MADKVGWWIPDLLHRIEQNKFYVIENSHSIITLIEMRGVLLNNVENNGPDSRVRLVYFRLPVVLEDVAATALVHEPATHPPKQQQQRLNNLKLSL